MKVVCEAATMVVASVVWHVICLNALGAPGFVTALPIWANLAFVLIPPTLLFAAILFATAHPHLRNGAEGRGRAIVYWMAISFSVAPIVWWVAGILLIAGIGGLYRFL